MCDTCKAAELALRKDLDRLIDEFPGSEVEGIAVERSHHVHIAMMHTVLARFVPAERHALAAVLMSDMLQDRLLNAMPINAGAAH